RYWRNAGANELLVVGFASISSGLLTIAAVEGLYLLFPAAQNWIPRSIPFIQSLLLIPFVIASRFSQRAYQQHFWIRQPVRYKMSTSRALIIGAGHTGVRVLDTLEHASGPTVVGFLDDDLDKVGTLVRGVKVFGQIDSLKSAVQQYDVNLVIIAIPSASGHSIRRIVTDCRTLGVTYKIVPNMYEVLNGDITFNQLRSVSIDDL